MHQRIVVKIGSSSLTENNNGIHHGQIQYFCRELAALQHSGYRVVLVTSGAVAAGYRTLGYPKRPQLLQEKQAAAAAGQAILMRYYQEEFARYEQGAAQLLLTRADFFQRQKMQNAVHTIEELIRCGAIPIINENDTVSTDELKFGDNDTLSALVANLIKADQLLILTDTDGLYTGDPRKNPEAERIERVEQISEEIFQIAGGAGSAVGTGGMRSKVEAARIAVRGGVPVFIGEAKQDGDMKLALQNRGKGTYFLTASTNLSTKKQWIGFHSLTNGSITIDSGAKDALLNGGRSLLPAGVITAKGDFHPSDVVEVLSTAGFVLGRGVVNYASWQLKAVAGLSSDEAAKRVDVPRVEVIHRDEWLPFQ